VVDFEPAGWSDAAMISTILMILLAVYLAGVLFALWRSGLAGWRAALLWPVIVVTFLLFWRHD
jgi:hypothetical protein